MTMALSGAREGPPMHIRTACINHARPVHWVHKNLAYNARRRGNSKDTLPVGRSSMIHHCTYCPYIIIFQRNPPIGFFIETTMGWLHAQPWSNIETSSGQYKRIKALEVIHLPDPDPYTKFPEPPHQKHNFVWLHARSRSLG